MDRDTAPRERFTRDADEYTGDHPRTDQEWHNPDVERTPSELIQLRLWQTRKEAQALITQIESRIAATPAATDDNMLWLRSLESSFATARTALGYIKSAPLTVVVS